MCIYENPTASVMRNGGRLVPPKIRNQTKISIVTTCIQHFLKILARAIKQRKEVKGIQIGKDKVKLSLLPYDLISYVENPKEILIEKHH